MSSIDNRKVEMQFDNAMFEQRIGQTMTSLDKLQKSLDFANANKKLNDLSTTGKNFSLGGMASAVENVSTKFLALATIGITALSNITNRAIDAGITLVKSLSLDPVMQGFQEYETNMNSIQTVLANTRSDGTTLQDVNSALDELNKYSDQTIYNFSEMTRNIGTFTAAGVDLESSTAAIKGIANLAAVSGSNSQQASTAMYQLSQALAAGKVSLMDWNSVVNAGMGGEVFQKSLFETGKALGTIKDVPMSQTFDEWKAAGNTFRNSLESGWITAEVLTNTLAGFTGDLTDAQLMSMGYTAEQAAEIVEMGKVAQAAATEVKTLTGLIDTTKESVASGWSQTFKLIIGDFEEAKTLFTDISGAIGGFVQRSSDSRNELLAMWKFFGGRTVLIEGLKNAFSALGDILEPIGRAFRDVFPPMTAERLYEITVAFRDFTERLKPSSATITNVRLIFQGLFAALEIGWTILKETAKFFIGLFKALVPSGGGGKALEFFGDLGVKINDLNKALVEGGGIAKFFEDLSENVKKFIDTAKGIFNALDFSSVDSFLNSLKDVRSFLEGFGTDAAGMTDSFGGLGGRFEWLTGLSDILSNAWSGVKDKFSGVSDTILELLGNMKENFGNLGGDLGEALQNADWSKVTEGLKIGLLGAIILFVKRLKDTLDFDFAKDAMRNVTEALGALTGTLEAMQLKLKAEALEKIAIAIGILVASVVVLSFIDGEKLQKAMTALAVGFGQLIAAFALISQITQGPAGAASLILTAGGLILLAGAVFLLSLAAKSISDLNWNELAKGLVGTTVLLGALSLAVIPLSANSGGMIRAGLGMIFIGAALNVIALAVKQFAGMSWGEMIQGLVGVAGALAAVTASMSLLPKGMMAKAAGVLLVAGALNLIALAVKQFSGMDWGEIGKGLLGIGGGLVAIAIGMQLMPANMILTGPALFIISLALLKIGEAVANMSALSWEDMARGLAGLAGSLIILAVGLTAMSGAIPGAIAVGIAAVSLKQMGKVLKQFSNIPWSDIAKGLLAIAATFAVIGVSGLLMAPVVPVLLALGAALILIGAGFALFGLGASLVGKAFQLIAEAGKSAVVILMQVLDGLIQRLPEFLAAVALGIVGMITEFVNAIPQFVEAGKQLLLALLTAIPEVMPGIATAITAVIQAILQVIRDNFPDIVTTGFEMLMALLQGIRDNIVQITQTVVEIIVEFINTVAANMDKIVEAGVNLVTEFVKAVISQLFQVQGSALDVVTEFVGEIAANAFGIFASGIGMIAEFIKGLASAILGIPAQATALVMTFIGQIVSMALFLFGAGLGIISDVKDGILDGITSAVTWALEQAKAIGEAIIDGIVAGIKAAPGAIADAVKGMVGGAIGAGLDALGIGGPSKVFIEMGEGVANGFFIGIENGTPKAVNAVQGLGVATVTAFREAIEELPTKGELLEFNPIIVPVVDLTNVKKGTQEIGALMTSVKGFDIDTVYNKAADVSVKANAMTMERWTEKEDSSKVQTEIKFEQNNFSPTALSTSDIYRQTKSQISMAKTELALT